MKKMIFSGLILIALLIQGTAYAIPEVSVSTDKNIYHYGQTLSLSIQVSEVTGSPATFEIVDQSGNISSPIHLDISKPISNLTAPVPFYKMTFPVGTYHINVQYSGSNATTSFQLIDTGEIAIPSQFKVVANSWSNGETPDSVFARDIQALITSGTISFDNFHKSSNVFIPNWFKNDAKWWANGSISDEDFGLAIKYLVETNVIQV